MKTMLTVISLLIALFLFAAIELIASAVGREFFWSMVCVVCLAYVVRGAIMSWWGGFAGEAYLTAVTKAHDELLAHNETMREAEIMTGVKHPRISMRRWYGSVVDDIMVGLPRPSSLRGWSTTRTE